MQLKKLDFIGSTVEEAIEKGLSIFNRTRDHVDVEVLDTGSKGIFGIGSKPAKVRMSLKPGDKLFDDPEDEEFEPEIPESAEAKPSENTVVSIETEVKAPAAPAAEIFESDPDSAEEIKTYPDHIVNENSLAITIGVVKDLLEHMRVKATVEGRIGVQEIGTNQPCILIDIKGDDLSYLIGRQSETLNAFQYITSLIVGRENGHWVPLQIDIQGYRARRERQLRQMAVRMADQVAKSGRKISLEPMPGPERRIIHMLLRNRADVYTESTGEEPNRKVVILSKIPAQK